MNELEVENLKEIKEIKNSIPIIDFIANPICDNFEMNGRLVYIQY